MSEQTPPDWVLIEAAKRCGREGTKPEVILDRWYSDATLRALCDMIEKYEQPPVDPVVTAIVDAMYDLEDGRSGASTESYAACLRNALAARGFEIREIKP